MNNFISKIMVSSKMYGNNTILITHKLVKHLKKS